jgi:hypothetical protein
MSATNKNTRLCIEGLEARDCPAGTFLRTLGSDGPVHCGSWAEASIEWDYLLADGALKQMPAATGNPDTIVGSLGGLLGDASLPAGADRGVSIGVSDPEEIGLLRDGPAVAVPGIVGTDFTYYKVFSTIPVEQI